MRNFLKAIFYLENLIFSLCIGSGFFYHFFYKPEISKVMLKVEAVRVIQFLEPLHAKLLLGLTISLLLIALLLWKFREEEKKVFFIRIGSLGLLTILFFMNLYWLIPNMKELLSYILVDSGVPHPPMVSRYNFYAYQSRFIEILLVLASIIGLHRNFVSK